MRIVIKCGSSLLTRSDGNLDEGFIADLCEQITGLFEEGHEVMLVSSGAVATGAGILGRRGDGSESTAVRQVLAAVGQSPLIETYRRCLEGHRRLAAQALISRSDLERRSGYLNARNACLALLGMGILPIVNENDVVATEELQFGDNDRLSALVANLVDADILVILTDVDGFYGRAANGEQKLLREVGAITDEHYRLAGASSGTHSVGGMRSKLDAARLAQSHGAVTVIASGRTPNVTVRIAGGERIGTWFSAPARRTGSRQRWMLAEFAPCGTIRVDSGAADALRNRRGSLLPVGVLDASGGFERGDLVTVLDADDMEIARGLASYDCQDVSRIAGASSSQISDRLGYEFGAEVIHRNNMVVL